MSNTKIYEDGSAELSLVRSLFPVVAVMGLMAIAWHFGGFESQSTEIDRLLVVISSRLAWIWLIAIPFLGLVILVTNPPRLKLSPLWVGMTTIGALGFLAIAFWLVSVTLAG